MNNSIKAKIASVRVTQIGLSFVINMMFQTLDFYWVLSIYPIFKITEFT